MTPIIEEATWDGRTLTVLWETSAALPPREQTTQASGICFTAEGQIVLVGDGTHWSLPGGHPEARETLKETLAREVWEEACAVVEQSQYLGAQKVTDPAEAAPYYQTRWWARVRLLSFDPRHEIAARRLIAPNELVATLNWETKQIAQAILEAALTIEAQQPNRAR